ncbi:hypothetical protein, partial [Bartonella bovis]|uniref:hypothetical protein n=1 Tax=Bartonella bovis TaxID=155194 RepID=UPI00178C6F81
MDGSGGSKGVEFKGTGGKGTLMLNMVEIEGFEKGVEASKGMVTMMGGSITIKENGGKGYGLNMQGEANATLMRTKIVGDRSGTGTGVVMGSTGTLMMNMVDISNVGVSGKYGVQMTGEGTMVMTSVDISGFEKGVSVEKGKLVMNGGSKITVTSGGTGLEVKGGASATMMGAVIKGTDGKGTGYGVKMMGEGKVEMVEVGISGVKWGICGVGR